MSVVATPPLINSKSFQHYVAAYSCIISGKCATPQAWKLLCHTLYL